MAQMTRSGTSGILSNAPMAQCMGQRNGEGPLIARSRTATEPTTNRQMVSQTDWLLRFAIRGRGVPFKGTAAIPPGHRIWRNLPVTLVV